MSSFLQAQNEFLQRFPLVVFIERMGVPSVQVFQWMISNAGFRPAIPYTVVPLSDRESFHIADFTSRNTRDIIVTTNLDGDELGFKIDQLRDCDIVSVDSDQLLEILKASVLVRPLIVIQVDTNFEQKLESLERKGVPTAIAAASLNLESNKIDKVHVDYTVDMSSGSLDSLGRLLTGFCVRKRDMMLANFNYSSVPPPTGRDPSAKPSGKSLSEKASEFCSSVKGKFKMLCSSLEQSFEVPESKRAYEGVAVQMNEPHAAQQGNGACQNAGSVQFTEAASSAQAERDSPCGEEPIAEPQVAKAESNSGSEVSADLRSASTVNSDIQSAEKSVGDLTKGQANTVTQDSGIRSSEPIIEQSASAVNESGGCITPPSDTAGSTGVAGAAESAEVSKTSSASSGWKHIPSPDEPHSHQNDKKLGSFRSRSSFGKCKPWGLIGRITVGISCALVVVSSVMLILMCRDLGMQINAILYRIDEANERLDRVQSYIERIEEELDNSDWGSSQYNQGLPWYYWGIWTDDNGSMGGQSDGNQTGGSSNDESQGGSKVNPKTAPGSDSADKLPGGSWYVWDSWSKDDKSAKETSKDWPYLDNYVATPRRQTENVAFSSEGIDESCVLCELDEVLALIRFDEDPGQLIQLSGPVRLVVW